MVLRRSSALIAAVCMASLLLTPQHTRADTAKESCVQAYADAQTLRMDGELLEARDQLQRCARAECPSALTADCTRWLAETELNVSSVVFAVTDPEGHDLAAASVRTGTRVLAQRSEGQAVLLNPGLHTFTVEANGFVPYEGQWVIRQSEKGRILKVLLTRVSQQSELSTTAPAPRTRASAFRLTAPTLVAGATAAVAVASFAYFGLAGMHKRDESEHCQVSCQQLIDDGKRDYIIADISLGAAVLAAGSAVLFAILGQPAASDRRTHSGALPLHWSARF